MKKNSILFAFILFICQSLSAQLDLKINPVAIAGGNAGASGEYIIGPNWGLELSGFAQVQPYRFVAELAPTAIVRLSGRYYFDPTNAGGDGFFVGAYSRYFERHPGTFQTRQLGIRSRIQRGTVGFTAGYKYLSQKGLVVEASFGIGSMLYNRMTIEGQGLQHESNDLYLVPDGYLNVSIGYRLH